MAASSKEPWVQYLETEVVGTYLQEQGLVYEIKLTIRPEEVFCVIRTKGPWGALVAFTSGRTLKAVADRIRLILSGEGGTWREDKYV